MTTNKLLYLSDSEITAIGVNARQVIDALEQVFLIKGRDGVEMPPKVGIHTRPDAFIHAMPAYVRGEPFAGVKWVSGYPENQEKGLPYITGLIILNDADTGVPVCIMDAMWITAIRTGAATALAAKYLARQESTTVGILGCGVQGRSNLTALCELFTIEHVYAYDIIEQQSSDFAKAMSAQTGAIIEVAAEPKQAVADRDIVITTGPILKTPHETIRSGWIKPGTFISPVDFDSYFSPQALAEASKFCTDDLEQLAYYKSRGYFQKIPSVFGDLGQIVSGQKPGRESKDEIIICTNLGLALEDIVVAPLVFERAKERGIGVWLPR